MSDEYEGEEGYTFNIDRLSAADFKDRCFIIGVSGIPINPYGHVLLEVGGHYFHVSRLGPQHPQWMTFDGFKRYCRENDKAILYRERIDDVRSPEKTKAQLAMRLKKRWHFGGHIVNCVTFAEDIVRAGGSQWDMEPHHPVEGPIRHATGFLDITASSLHQKTAREQRCFWPLEKVRRLRHKKYEDYVRGTNKVAFRFWWSGGQTPAFQELLDAK